MTPVELLAALRAKGITLAVNGNRLRACPWTSMNDEERASFREHRAELKRFVLSGAAFPLPRQPNRPGQPWNGGRP